MRIGHSAKRTPTSQDVTRPKISPKADKINSAMAKEFPLKVLVAEDNAVNAKVIGLILGKLGYTHELAKNGLEAVEASSRTRFDVIIMDLQMPEMDGFDATRKILAESKPDEAPYIFALTANAQMKDQIECMKAGMRDFLTKPAYPATIAAALARAYRTRQKISLVSS